MAQQPLSGPGPPHYRGFTITLRHITLGKTPLDEWSTRRRDLYLTTHNTHNRQTSISIPPAGFEHTIPASERPQTHALDRTPLGSAENYKTVILFYKDHKMLNAQGIIRIHSHESVRGCLAQYASSCVWIRPSVDSLKVFTLTITL
jgi:hypothetical protein